MSTQWYNEPTSPAWQIGHSIISAISLYRTATIGIQEPNKAPTSKAQYENPYFVVIMIDLMPKALQAYMAVAIAFLMVRAGVALVSPDDLPRMCNTCPPMWLTLTGIVGALLGLAGTELRQWCYNTLGKYFTFHLAVQKDQPLITTGPYTYLRHPAYSGAFLIGVGTELSVILCNPVSLCYGRNSFKYSKEVEIAFLALAFFPPIAAIVKRMGNEEKMLKAKYGKKYTEWESRTWRMIPFVY